MRKLLEEKGRKGQICWPWSWAWEPWGLEQHRKVLAAETELGLETSPYLTEDKTGQAVPQPLIVFKTTKALFML